MKLTTLLTAALLCAAPVFADPIVLPFNTGVMSDGTVVTGPAVDMHYTALDSSTVYVEGAPAYYAWIGPDTLSAWIGPDTQDGSIAAGGYYTLDYLVNFDVTGFDPASVTLTGQVATDNTLNDILVNGNSTVSSTSNYSASNFSSFTPFSLNSGFVGGMNTIDFNFTNNGGPGGLRVEFTGANGNLLAATPEPASLALIGFGIAGLGVIRRYKSSK